MITCVCRSGAAHAPIYSDDIVKSIWRQCRDLILPIKSASTESSPGKRIGHAKAFSMLGLGDGTTELRADVYLDDGNENKSGRVYGIAGDVQLAEDEITVEAFDITHIVMVEQAEIPKPREASMAELKQSLSEVIDNLKTDEEYSLADAVTQLQDKYIITVR